MPQPTGHGTHATPGWRQRWNAIVAQAHWLAPLFCGLLSIAIGQDVNWDLLNYHLYNPYAWLTGRIGYDLGPAQWQSYFNPTIDVLYYALVMSLPGWGTSFVMGALHGLNFPLLLALGRRLLPRDAPPQLPFWLAAAGFLGPAFVSELGNTMGDNLTALFVLGALLLVLRRRGMADVLLAGFVIGLGTGLKLTNAVYSLALCIALLAAAGTWRERLHCAVLFGMAVLAGIAVAGGHWYWTMWQQFGNPLFPQFNNHFLSPMAAPIGVGDTAWLPRTLAEKILWPFIFTADPRRVSELPLRHLAWPLLYASGILLLLALATGRRRLAALAVPARVVLVFGGVAYLLWLNLFSIYRYLVPLELLAPLLCWLVLDSLLPGRRRLAAICIAVCACSVVTVASWGHAGRGKAFTVDVPPFAAPAQSLVYIVLAPTGWLVPFFPPEVAFISLGAGFPESPAWVGKAEQMRRSRTGPFYVLLPADRSDPRKPDPVRIQREQQELVALAARALGKYGLAVPGACRSYQAYVGRMRQHYQLCEVVAAPR